MISRGRYNKSQHDWDPMQEDYNDTIYDSQYADDDVNGGVPLDHCKLYVKNINKALNQEGLRAAFAKYANNMKIYMSKDPVKRYAIVTFDTPGEAKHAMMKLNRTEPLKLIISVAHKKRDTQGSYQTNNRDDSASGSSKGWSSRKQEERNGDNSQDFSMDDVDLGSDQDYSELEEVELKLKYYSLQAESIKCKQRLSRLHSGKKPSSQKPPSNRYFLPDGRIVVRNTESQGPTDNVFSSAGGDSSLPALQHHQSRKCLWCDFPADLYCGRCGVAPYCSPRCQQKDWLKRHRDVCHNLLRARAVIPETKAIEPEIKKESKPRVRETEINKKFNPRVREPEPKKNKPKPISEPPAPMASLRHPYSPAGNRGNNSDRTKRNFHSAGQKVNRNSNFKNYNNIRRPNLQSIKNQQEEEELIDLKDEENPAQVAKPLQEDNPSPDVTPKVETKATIPKVMPQSYLFDTLSPGDTGLLSVESDAASCKGKSGFICLALHENTGDDYEKLCRDYSLDGAIDESYTPKPGDLFSFENPEDNCWYRARCLNKSLAALIDSSKLVDLSADSVCKKITPKYENMPEFCCELNAEGIQIGDNLKCTIISKSGSTCKVSLENIETNAVIGEGEINRWKPTVDFPVTSSVIPQIQRPDLKNNSLVLLVRCNSSDNTFIRPADRESMKKFDMTLNDTLESAKTAVPMKESPKRGQTVIAKLRGGLSYRALVTRTSEKLNKYMLEYAEYGNREVYQKGDIMTCPDELTLDNRPTVVMQGDLKLTAKEFTNEATEYLKNIRDSETELLLTLTDGSNVAPSGSNISLTVTKNKASLKEKLDKLCTPQWQKKQVKGQDDGMEIPRLMFSDLSYPSLPESGCELMVLDTTLLEMGVINGCQRLPETEQTLEKLEQKLAEYCNSEFATQPYLPSAEELCIVKCPHYEQWFRAVLCEQTDGPGSSRLQVCYIDYGNLATVPLSAVRKMLPEFVMDIPAAALHIEIRDFPKEPSTDMLIKALLHMKTNEEGRGSLEVVRCVEVEPGSYIVEAPELLKAIKD